ncbi:MAG: glycosyltransferase family 39 protein [Spirochaetota bacterium]
MRSIKQILSFCGSPNVRLAFLIAVLACTFFGQLGANLIKFFDDTYHVTMAHDFAVRGDIFGIQDTLLRTPYFEKPPFMLMLSSLGIKLFGATSFGARSFIAFYCLVSVMLGYVLLRRDAGERTAFAASLIAGTTFQILHFSRRVGFDGVLAASLYIAFLLFFFADRHRSYYLLFGAAIGIAVMTKGVSGIIPLAAVGIYCLALPNGRARLRDPFLYSSMITFLAVVLPWHIGMISRHGEVFVRTYFWERQLAYFLPGKGSGHGAQIMSADINFRKIGDTYWPYLPFLLYAVIDTIVRTVRRKHDGAFSLRWYAVIWIFVILGLYQLASIKRYAYVLPIYYGMAVLIAAGTTSWRFGKQIVIGFSIVAAGMAVAAFTPKWKDIDWSGWEEHRPIITELNRTKTPYALFPLFQIYVQPVMIYDGYAFHAPYFTNVRPGDLEAFYTNGGSIVMLDRRATNSLPYSIRRSMRVVFDSPIASIIARAR